MEVFGPIEAQFFSAVIKNRDKDLFAFDLWLVIKNRKTENEQKQFAFANRRYVLVRGEMTTSVNGRYVNRIYMRVKREQKQGRCYISKQFNRAIENFEMK